MATFICSSYHAAFSPSDLVGGAKYGRPIHYLSSMSSLQRSSLRGSTLIAQVGFMPSFLSELGSSDGVVRELVDRAEGALFTVADVAASSSEAIITVKEKSDWFSGITNCMESVLTVLKNGLSSLHVPYSYGFAIILLTVIVKAATYPLTKKQVESAMTMRSLQPILQAIHQQYAGDKEKIQLETARLYRLAGINPLAGILPTLLTIPVWIGLYRALSNVANEGLLTEGFFWIPSLAGPTTFAAGQGSRGISWLFPFVDGHPPLGWSNTLAYLVLPLLLIVSQYVAVQIMQSAQGNDPNVKRAQSFTKFLPLFMGYFALSVPSGLSLYWLTNNVLTTAQQIWLQKFGGAKIPPNFIKDNTGRGDKSRGGSSLPAMNSVKHDLSEKLTPDGKKPGERFRQIKEQEAKRRQLIEEESGYIAHPNTIVDPGNETRSNGHVSTMESKLDEMTSSVPAGVGGGTHSL